MAKIASINASRYLLPLAEVLVDARHGEYHHFELVTATMRLTDGTEGAGYTCTGGRGGAAILAAPPYAPLTAAPTALDTAP